MPTSCVASTSKAAPLALAAVAMRAMSSAPPSDQWTEEIETRASGSAPGRSIAAITADVQSPSAGCFTVSTAKPPASARLIHSSTGEVWSSCSTSTRLPRGIVSTLPAVETP